MKRLPRRCQNMHNIYHRSWLFSLLLLHWVSSLLSLTSVRAFLSLGSSSSLTRASCTLVLVLLLFLCVLLACFSSRFLVRLSAFLALSSAFFLSAFLFAFLILLLGFSLSFFNCFCSNMTKHFSLVSTLAPLDLWLVWKVFVYIGVKNLAITLTFGYHSKRMSRLQYYYQLCLHLVMEIWMRNAWSTLN